AAAVVVSPGAGGPGIGRRVARPPGTKNRGICRARDDARRSAPPCANRSGRYRADQREMPGGTPRELDSGPSSGFALWSAHVSEVARLHHCRCPDARARHWREYGNFFSCEWRAAAASSLSTLGTAYRGRSNGAPVRLPRAALRAEFPRLASPRQGRSEETRLNSSHVAISYAVFCLKKKKQTQTFILNQKKSSSVATKIIKCT